MKHLLLFLLMTLSIMSCNILSKNTTHKKVVTKKTSKHINFPGTKLFIVPPKGFSFHDGENILKNDDESFVQVFDLVGGNFYTNAANFTKEGITEKGLNVYDFQEFDFNHYPAKYIEFGNSVMYSNSMVFGDTTFSASILCVSKKSKVDLHEQFRKMIYSAYYDPNFEINPFENFSFVLYDTNSLYKFQEYTGNVFMYKTEDTLNKEIDNKAFLMAMQLPAENQTLDSLSEEINQSLTKYGMIFFEKKYRSTEKINGYEALETHYWVETKGQKMMNFQLILKKDFTAVVVQGTIMNNFDKTVEEFKKLAYTVKFK